MLASTSHWPLAISATLNEASITTSGVLSANIVKVAVSPGMYEVLSMLIIGRPVASAISCSNDSKEVTGTNDTFHVLSSPGSSFHMS